MAHYDHQQAPVAYPPPGQVYPPPPQSAGGPYVTAPPPPQSAEGPYVTAPPPIGYPTKDDGGYPELHHPVESRSRGDGFWEGCFAALCCCCVLDVCCC